MTELIVSLELLYHYRCGDCDRWWSVADIAPIPRAIVHCPHCGLQGIVPEKVLIGQDFENKG